MCALLASLSKLLKVDSALRVLSYIRSRTSAALVFRLKRANIIHHNGRMQIKHEK